VVSQTQEVHEEIVDLLEQLRKLQDLQVTIEVRFITLEDDFFERIGVDFNFEIPTSIDRRTKSSDKRGRVVPPMSVPPPISTTSQGVARNVTTPNTKLGAQAVTVGVGISQSVSRRHEYSLHPEHLRLCRATVRRLDPTMGGTLDFAILSDIQAYFFIQAIHGDNRSNILQAPR